MSRIVNVLRKLVSVAVSLVVIALFILLVGSKLMGFQYYAILSGSMEPTYPVGSLVYVREVKQLAVGDCMTFYINQRSNIVTHQVVTIDPQTGAYTTKGIANETADVALVAPSEVIGKVFWCVPYLGRIVRVITTPLVLYGLFAIFILWLSIRTIMRLFCYPSNG